MGKSGLGCKILKLCFINSVMDSSTSVLSSPLLKCESCLTRSMCYPLPVTQKPRLSRSSSPFECVRPSRPLKADRPHRSHCHRSSTAMNISGAQRHTKNVEKLLACVPSEQNRPPSHVEAEGIRNLHKKKKKSMEEEAASSLLTGSATACF